MAGGNYYDVTKWQSGDPYEDVGEVINSILADIKSRQAEPDIREGGKPGAVIYLPPGDYHLKTQVVIDISYLKIMGAGHGFTSSSIRFNVPKEEWKDLHELWPGGSRILVDLAPKEGEEECSGAAFYVNRNGSPRLSSVEFSDFCIDGLHFEDDGSGDQNPENSYVNGKTGIYVASPNDSFRITGMGIVYLEHGLTIYHADALSIHDNFIAECGNCVELRGWGQASKVTDNFFGAGYKGYSLYAQNFGALLVAANNIFPRGASSVFFDRVMRSSITGNRLHSFYPGMIVLERDSSENLISSNHILRDREPWPPMQMHDNGLEDRYGLIYIDGDNNTVTANHISEFLEKKYVRPADALPVMIHLASGKGNYICGNHIVAMQPGPAVKEGDSCFSMQVEALLSAKNAVPLEVTAVFVEKESVQNIVLDSGSAHQVILDRSVNAFRATPAPGICE